MIVTESDREVARQAMATGWNNCQYTNNLHLQAKPCDCDPGAVDGCKARVEAIAAIVAACRTSAVSE